MCYICSEGGWRLILPGLCARARLYTRNSMARRKRIGLPMIWSSHCRAELTD